MLRCSSTVNKLVVYYIILFLIMDAVDIDKAADSVILHSLLLSPVCRTLGLITLLFSSNYSAVCQAFANSAGDWQVK